MLDVAAFCLGAVNDQSFPYLKKTPCISSIGKWAVLRLRPYMHAYIHHTYLQYIHTYIHTVMAIHTYIHAYLYTYIKYTFIKNTHIHKYIRTYIYTYIPTNNKTIKQSINQWSNYIQITKSIGPNREYVHAFI